MSNLNLSIEWNLDLGNYARIKQMIDINENKGPFIFEAFRNKSQNMTIFLGKRGEERRWYTHGYNFTKGNAGGYGGASFELMFKDGNTVTIQGPWSGSDSLINNLLFDMGREEEMVVETSGSTGISRKAAEEFLKENNIDYHWCGLYEKNEPSLFIPKGQKDLKWEEDDKDILAKNVLHPRLFGVVVANEIIGFRHTVMFDTPRVLGSWAPQIAEGQCFGLPGGLETDIMLKEQIIRSIKKIS